MTTEQALIQAIVQDPDSDTPRLIYADFLDEIDQPARAELIRIQCAREGISRYDARQVELEAREKELLANCGNELLGPVANLGRGWTFRRGFLTGGELKPVSSRDEIKAFLQFAPLFETWRCVTNDEGHVNNSPNKDLIELLFESGRITGIDLSKQKLDPNSAADFLSMSIPPPSNVRRLDLSFTNLNADGLREALYFYIDEYLIEFHELNLEGNVIENACWADRKCLGELRTLNLAGNGGLFKLEGGAASLD